jgi:hypothetical protein
MIQDIIIDGVTEVDSRESSLWPGKCTLTIKYNQRLLITGPMNSNTIEIGPDNPTSLSKLEVATGFEICPVCSQFEKSWSNGYDEGIEANDRTEASYETGYQSGYDQAKIDMEINKISPKDEEDER